MSEQLREMEAVIARWMGYDVVGFASVSHQGGAPVVVCEEREDYFNYGPVMVDEHGCLCDEDIVDFTKVHGHYTYCLSPIPNYSSSLDAMAVVEARIKEKNLWRYYTNMLDDIVHPDWIEGNAMGWKTGDIFDIVTASAEQRVRAAVKVLEGMRDA